MKIQNKEKNQAIIAGVDLICEGLHYESLMLAVAKISNPDINRDEIFREFLIQGIEQVSGPEQKKVVIEGCQHRKQRDGLLYEAAVKAGISSMAAFYVAADIITIDPKTNIVMVKQWNNEKQFYPSITIS
jgi:hypothetical protein